MRAGGADTGSIIYSALQFRRRCGRAFSLRRSGRRYMFLQYRIQLYTRHRVGDGQKARIVAAGRDGTAGDCGV